MHAINNVWALTQLKVDDCLGTPVNTELMLMHCRHAFPRAQTDNRYILICLPITDITDILPAMAGHNMAGHMAGHNMAGHMAGYPYGRPYGRP